LSSLDILLDIAQLARSTFHDNLNKPDNPDKALKAEIKRIFIKNDGRYD